MLRYLATLDIVGNSLLLYEDQKETFYRENFSYYFVTRFGTISGMIQK